MKESSMTVSCVTICRAAQKTILLYILFQNMNYYAMKLLANKTISSPALYFYF